MSTRCSVSDVEATAATAAQLVVPLADRRVAFAFRHALVAEALLATVSPARRSQLHGAIAVALETLRTDRTLDTVSRLACHWLESVDDGGRRTGARYAEMAGDLSVAAFAFAYADACRWYQRSLEADELTDDVAVRCRRELGLARAATLAGDEPLARRAAKAAWALARSRDRAAERAASLLFAGEPELNVVGDEPGQVILRSTLEAAWAVGEDDALVMARLGSALSYGPSHAEAMRLAVESLELARRSGDPAALAYVIRCRLRCWFDPERAHERIAMAEELTELGQLLDDPVTESWGWRWQGVTRYDLGESLRSREHYIDFRNWVTDCIFRISSGELGSALVRFGCSRADSMRPIDFWSARTNSLGPSTLASREASRGLLFTCLTG